MAAEEVAVEHRAGLVGLLTSTLVHDDAVLRRLEGLAVVLQEVAEAARGAPGSEVRVKDISRLPLTLFECQVFLSTLLDARNFLKIGVMPRTG
jgi:hypothetical protein